MQQLVDKVAEVMDRGMIAGKRVEELENNPATKQAREQFKKKCQKAA